MQKPRRPEGAPVVQPGDDVGPPYLEGDEGSSARPEGIGEDAADTLRDPDVHRPRPQKKKDVDSEP